MHRVLTSIETPSTNTSRPLCILQQQFPLWEEMLGCSRDFAIAQDVLRCTVNAIAKSRLRLGIFAITGIAVVSPPFVHSGLLV